MLKNCFPVVIVPKGWKVIAVWLRFILPTRYAFDGEVELYMENIQTDPFTAFVIGTASSKQIVAAKLELGSEQTLAHQENGKWVLNEIPKYKRTLSDCQRYQFFMNIYAMFPAVRIEPGYIDFMVPCPVTMRARPNIVNAQNFQLMSLHGGNIKTNLDVSVAADAPNSFRVRAIVPNHGLTTATLETNGPVGFDANL